MDAGRDGSAMRVPIAVTGVGFACYGVCMALIAVARVTLMPRFRQTQSGLPLYAANVDRVMAYEYLVHASVYIAVGLVLAAASARVAHWVDALSRSCAPTPGAGPHR